MNFSINAGAQLHSKTNDKPRTFPKCPFGDGSTSAEKHWPTEMLTYEPSTPRNVRKSSAAHSIKRGKGAVIYDGMRFKGAGVPEGWEKRSRLEVVTGSKEDTWTPPAGPTEYSVWEKMQPLLETTRQETVSSGDSDVAVKGRWKYHSEQRWLVMGHEVQTARGRAEGWVQRWAKQERDCPRPEGGVGGWDLWWGVTWLGMRHNGIYSNWKPRGCCSGPWGWRADSQDQIAMRHSSRLKMSSKDTRWEHLRAAPTSSTPWFWEARQLPPATVFSGIPPAPEIALSTTSLQEFTEAETS